MDQNHPDFKTIRKKRIMKRIMWLIASWIIFILAYFYLPLPKGMKRSFTEQECEKNGGHWQHEHQRCLL